MSIYLLIYLKFLPIFIFLSAYQSIFIYINISLCLPCIYISVFHPFWYLSVYPSKYLSLNLSIFLFSIQPYFCLSIHQNICPAVFYLCPSMYSFFGIFVCFIVITSSVIYFSILLSNTIYPSIYLFNLRSLNCIYVIILLNNYMKLLHLNQGLSKSLL